MEPLHLPDGPIGCLDAEDWSAIGSSPLAVIDLADAKADFYARRLSGETAAIVLGVDREGSCPASDESLYDCLLTIANSPPRPWVSVPSARVDKVLTAIGQAVAAAPIAANALARVLRINEHLTLADALEVESFAFSTLLSGSAFARWRNCRSASDPPDGGTRGPLVEWEREADQVTLTLSSPETHNAMSAAMRDALFEALAAVLDDPTRPTLTLAGAGRCFSVGGEIAEFGTASDLALAHAIRTARSCVRLIAELGDRAHARLHGACIGSGIEVPAAAAHRTAAPGSFFQLPELGMGLIPGAGGTVSISRAIGRHRTAWMVLSGQRISAVTAHDWGLIHEIVAK